MFGLFACGKKNEVQTTPEPAKEYIAVNVENQVKQAKIWIIPDTEKNRQTSLWGEVTADNLATGEKMSCQVVKSEESDLYLIRIIDEKELYYEGNGIEIKNNQTVVIKDNEDDKGATAEVYDENGNLINEYKMFVAHL